MNDDVDNTPAVPEQKAKSTELMSGRLLKRLTRVTFGTTLPKHLEDLKNRRSAHDEYTSSMEHPKGIVEKRFERLDLDGRAVVVTKYSTEDDIQVILDALIKFDSSFDAGITIKSQLRRIPIIEQFLCSSDHCRITTYTFELRMCGKYVCYLCARIDRNISTPDGWTFQFQI